VTGVAVHAFEQALEIIEAFRQQGHYRLVLKRNLSLAGHGAIRFWEPELSGPQSAWINRALERGGTLVIEPWLERVADFSLQLEMNGSQLLLRGYTGLCNDPKGQFRANWAEASHRRKLPAAVFTSLPGGPRDAIALQSFYHRLLAALQPRLRQAGFQGPLGIDAFLYRDPHGSCRVKPLVEINPRHTMGRLATELMRHVAPGCHGLFRLLRHQQAVAAGFSSLADWAAHLQKSHPPQLQGDPVPRLSSGLICLNDPLHARSCLATFQVHPQRVDMSVAAGALP
jgi:hypothetical protein